MPSTLPRQFAAYYAALDEFKQLGAHNEGATSLAFYNLLADMGRDHKLSVLRERTVQGTKKRAIRVDGLVRDLFFTRGVWEAKDTSDDLGREIDKKIASGYPLTNTIFEDTRRAVLFQNGHVALDCDIRQPAELQRLLDQFFSYSEPEIEEFHKAVVEFRQRIPELAAGLTDIIEEAKRTNPAFRAALDNFLTLCREALNPSTTQAEVEDMLKQHILTERIFRSIFDNPDFVRRNAVAVELEKMVDALTGQSFSRNAFLRRLDFFYVAIERAAATIEDYQEKQSLLNTLYEPFFQAYSTRAADTHGIVYTPHEIVAWMVKSVEKALEAEFGLSLASPGVHIIDPCVGTGTFIMELLQHIPSSALEAKYANELHANEVLLLPYYIAAQNIEHAHFERTSRYAQFDGLCFADTLDLVDRSQPYLPAFAPANTQRIEKQKEAPIFVVIGNPPYNAWQGNENDNNKNRKYETINKGIRSTYAKSSHATNKNALNDMYVKFFRWATDRLGDRDGIVCFVSNNGFLRGVAFDGFRQHLLQDFTRIYHFDFKGNARTSGERRRQEGGNIFSDQIRTGIGITLLIRNAEQADHEVFYHVVGDYWTAEEKKEYLKSSGNYTDVTWRRLTPDARSTWLTAGMHTEFNTLLPMGSKEAKAMRGLDVPSIFSLYSSGVKTKRDNWVYDFNAEELGRKVRKLIDTYNSEVDRWKRHIVTMSVDDFVLYDEEKIKWSESLKVNLVRSKYTKFDSRCIRPSLYRPFCREFLYFDRILNERVYVLPMVFPTTETEYENSVICVSANR